MKHAVYCATRNMYDDMETAAKSLVANSDVDRVHFLIEDAEFPRPLPDFIECHDVSGQEWFPDDGPNARKRWTYMVLMRTVLCHVLPDVDMVLSLDCDAIAVGDCSAIWDTDMGGCYLAGVRERWIGGRPGTQYVNMGVSLHNLAMLRDGKADEIVGVLNSHEFAWPDQDAMNWLCNGRIKELDGSWCHCPWTVEPTEPKRIIHYAAANHWKPNWREEPTTAKYREMSWDDVIASREYAGMPTVLFASNHSLERDESIRAVWDAYKGPKRLIKPVEAIANVRGYPVVVTDTLTPYVPDKDFILVNVGHGITGEKKYALDEKRPGIDPRALAQTDYHVCASTKTVDIVARQFGIPLENVQALGFPRSDFIIGKKKGNGGTFMAKFERAYLYAPTFRGHNDGDRLPRIDWAKLDAMMDDDEVLVVKRHYFTAKELVGGKYPHIVEVTNADGISPHLVDCDVLISDYSSVMFEAMLLNVPVVLACDDYEAYLRTRGMYFDYPEGYSGRWIMAEGNEEGLLAMMREAAANGPTDTEKALVDTVADMCDGHASERVCDFIRSLM